MDALRRVNRLRQLAALALVLGFSFFFFVAFVFCFFT